MHRYIAPSHLSAVFAPSGEKRVNRDGEFRLAQDAPLEDHRALLAAGCYLAAPDPVVGAENAPPARAAASRAQSPAKAPAKALAAPAQGSGA